MGVREKVKARMDQLQEMMEANKHLERQYEVHEQLAQVSKFWSVLDDEDKDYIHACRHALEYQSRWELPE